MRGDHAVVLHKDNGRLLARGALHGADFIADGESELRAGVGIGHKADGIGRVLGDFRHDFARVRRAGREIGIHAVAVRHERIQNRVEARFHRGAQRLQPIDGDDQFLGAIGTGLFHVFKFACFVRVIKFAQGGRVQHRVSFVFLNVGKLIARRLDGHLAIREFHRSVSAAALHIIRPRAHGLRHAHKIFQRLVVFRKKVHSHASSFFSSLYLADVKSERRG